VWPVVLLNSAIAACRKVSGNVAPPAVIVSACTADVAMSEEATATPTIATRFRKLIMFVISPHLSNTTSEK
jgi:hypothetical protein